MKNGSRDGTTEFAHKANPDLVAVRFVLEYMSKNIINRHIKKGIICFFILNINIFKYAHL